MLLVISPAALLGPPCLPPCDARNRVMSGDFSLAGPGRGLRRVAFRSLKVQTAAALGAYSIASRTSPMPSGLAWGVVAPPAAQGSPHLAGGRVIASVHPQGLCTCQEHSLCDGLLELQPPGTPASWSTFPPSRRRFLLPQPVRKHVLGPCSVSLQSPLKDSVLATSGSLAHQPISKPPCLAPVGSLLNVSGGAG